MFTRYKARRNPSSDTEMRRETERVENGTAMTWKLLAFVVSGIHSINRKEVLKCPNQRKAWYTDPLEE